MKARLFSQFLLLASIAACSPPPTVEQQVIAAIREMESHVENAENRQFIADVAEDFDGQNGQFNRQQLRALIIYQLNRNTRINAQLFPISVHAENETAASASFRAMVTGGPGWIPERGQLYEIETHWELDGRGWMLKRATWKPVL